MRPKVRLQSDLACSDLGQTRITTALRARQGPAAASGGALRAALTRAHAVASVQLCDEGAPSSRVAPLGGTKRTSYSLRRFLLDGGVQIPLLGDTLCDSA